MKISLNIWGYHGHDYENRPLLEYDAVYFVRQTSKLRIKFGFFLHCTEEEVANSK